VLEFVECGCCVSKYFCNCGWEYGIAEVSLLLSIQDVVAMLSIVYYLRAILRTICSDLITALACVERRSLCDFLAAVCAIFLAAVTPVHAIVQ